jgi:hypothetical protein
MGRTKRTQVALYLDADKVEQLGKLAVRTKRTQQDVLRDALDAELSKHKPLRPSRRVANG